MQTRWWAWRKKLAALLGALALFTAAAEEAADKSVDAAARKSAKYLWKQQSEDGGWHSETYGLLKSGQALTPFVLNTLLQVPDDIYPLPKEKVAKALAFIRAQVDKDGAVGTSDPLLSEYPNYATALAVLAFCRAGRLDDKEDRALIEKMAAYLLSQQFKGEWTKEHLAYGAWGFGGFKATPPVAGHVDLSMTRYVLDALRAAAPAEKRPAYTEAEVYLARCQNFDAQDAALDGGFFFSTVIPALNKAGHDGKRFRSYGTATADGILALLSAGIPADDPRVKAAFDWLSNHHGGGGVPGVPVDEDKGWDVSIRFYYASVSAQTFRRLNIKPAAGDKDWRKPLIGFVLKSQRPAGSFANNNLLMKEDDPLIATPLALDALIAVR